MNRHKIQNLKALREEMKTVARGQRPAPVDAAVPSFNSVASGSASVDAERTGGCSRSSATASRSRSPPWRRCAGRSQPNLTRTLAKLEAAGLITMQAHGRRKTPSAAVGKIIVEIDPYSDRDRLLVA